MELGRNYAGESLPDRTARRRRQLLDSGLELFATHGFRNVTVRQLCARAQVAHRAFYDEFANTEELLIAVYEQCLDQLQNAVSDQLAALVAGDPGGTDLDTAITASLQAFLDVIESDQRLAQVIWFEVLGVSPAVEANYLRRAEGFVVLLDTLIDSWGLATTVPLSARSVILRALVGGINYVAMTWFKSGYVQPRAEVVEALTLLLRTSSTLLVRLDAPAH